MRIEASISDVAVLCELGKRLEAVRLERNQTQAEVAELAGVSLQSIKRLESGQAGTRLPNFIAICRALDLLERFELLAPAPGPSPIDLLRLQGNKRQRARKRKSKPKQAWDWAEPE